MPKKTTARRKTSAKKTTARRTAPRRADYGAPIDGFFAKQPAPLRAILVALRALIEDAAPHAEGSIKWGSPFYAVNGQMTFALSAHKSHVNLIMVGPPDAFDDPDGRLEGGGKGGRHLKLRALDELPRASVKRWLRTSLKYARGAAARKSS